MHNGFSLVTISDTTALNYVDTSNKILQQRQAYTYLIGFCNANCGVSYMALLQTP